MVFKYIVDILLVRCYNHIVRNPLKNYGANMITLRKASPEDGQCLAAIYRYYVENTSVTFEYVAPSGDEFAERIASKTKKYPFIVAVENGEIIGYAYASEYRERAAYSWDVELSVYVSHTRTGGGIGRMLYSALEEILKLQNIVNLYACITYPNPHSISMHERLGFCEAGRLHQAGFKLGEWHDVLWMEKHISHPSEPMQTIPYPQLDKSKINEILNNYYLEAIR